MAYKPSENAAYTYAVGRVRALESYLLPPAVFERMLEAPDFDAALTVVRDHGYDEYLPERIESAAELETALGKVLWAAVIEVKDLSLDPAATDAWFARYDAANARLALREVYGEPSYEGAPYANAGNVSPEDLARAVESGDLGGLDPAFVGVLRRAMEIAEKEHDFVRADAALETGWFGMVRDAGLRGGVEFLVRLAAVMADLYNAEVILRGSFQGRGREELAPLMSDAGVIPVAELLAALENPAAELPRVLSRHGYHRVSRAMSGGSPERLGRLYEAEAQRFTMDFVKETKRLPFSVEPLVAFVMAMETELANVRLVLKGKWLGVETERLRGRLREHYGP